MESRELPSLAELWIIAAVLAGFQVTALGWRFNREIQMEGRSERTSLTLPDLFVTASFLLVATGVFVAPIAGTASQELAAKTAQRGDAHLRSLQAGFTVLPA